MNELDTRIFQLKKEIQDLKVKIKINYILICAIYFTFGILSSLFWRN